MSELSALVFSIHRLSTDDGPGLRDSFFLKGCSLRCAWCHNPESFSARPEIWWLPQRCIGACECIHDCPKQSLALNAQGLVIDRRRCTGCGICLQSCPSKAIEPLGLRWTVAQMVEEALKESVFYRNSGGGVTVSGGEPCLQAKFVAAFFAACRENGIHTALDTCGYPPWDDWEPVLEHTDLVLYDLKESNPERHRAFTGVPNKRINSNLKHLAEYQKAHQGHPAIWIRTPLIPDYTATVENVSAIGSFLAQTVGEGLERWELCAFNNTCQAKYDKMGLDWRLKGKSLLNREHGEQLLQAARRCLAWPPTVQLTGLI
jgi:pyruvate formate lyase activating enzyme